MQPQELGVGLSLGTCGSRRGVSGACDLGDNSDCGSSLVCSGTSCRWANGHSCFGNSQCECIDNLCNNRVCTSTSCILDPGPGTCSWLMISLGNIGAQHMSLYGYERQTTPRIDAFARDAIIFENAFSPAS